MKIVFMGTPDFAVPSLKILFDNKYNVCAVVTQPDRPKGRGNTLTPPPVKQLALEYHIPVYQPEKIRNNTEFISLLKGINPDMIVVVAFGQILTKEVLDIPKLGCINVHGSLLPKYRGSAPIQWAVINGDKTTGITTMFMDEGIDTGDMILKKETVIDDEETSETLYNRLSIMGSELLLETINLILNNKATRIKQDDSQATKAPMLDKELGNIDWSMDAEKIKNLVRGTYPWPGAYTFYKGEKIKIFMVDVENKNVSDAKPGTIVDITKDDVAIQTGRGLIHLKEIQAQNGKRMNIRNYLIGHTIDKNSILHGAANGIIH